MVYGTNNLKLDSSLNQQYEVLTEVQASFGCRKIFLKGTEWTCRYCGAVGRENFRIKAHTFPEALGNKYVFSLDECDRCNRLFASYEDSLVKALGPLLTIGGVKGKRGVRQSGRSKSSVSIRHSNDRENKRRVSYKLKGFEIDEVVSISKETGKLSLRVPLLEIDKFTPRYAYKALAKMGFAILPQDEVENYSKLRAWLLDKDDNEDFPVLEANLCLGSIGNSPPIVSGVLLRRKIQTDNIPYIIFVFCAGSVCFYIDLISDHLEDHIPFLTKDSINIAWRAKICAPEQSPVTIEYQKIASLNLSSSTLHTSLISELSLEFDSNMSSGHWFVSPTS